MSAQSQDPNWQQATHVFPAVIGQLRYSYGGAGHWVALHLRETDDPVGLLAQYREASLEGEAASEYTWLDQVIAQGQAAVGHSPDEALAALVAAMPAA